MSSRCACSKLLKRAPKLSAVHVRAVRVPAAAQRIAPFLVRPAQSLPSMLTCTTTSPTLATSQGEEEEEEGMTPAQTAQHFAMRNLMNAAGVLDGLQQYERGQELLGRAADIAVCAWGPGSMQHLNVLYALAQHFRWG